MTPRPQFSGTGAPLTAGIAAAPRFLTAQPQALPTSIASLSSMKALAKPINADERRARIERARKLMAENKLDAILLCSGTSLVYFSGIHWWPSERFFAM